MGATLRNTTVCAVAVGLLAAANAGGEPMVVEGVDHFRYMDPLFESVRVILAHRGETYSPAYIQGISGMAFRIGGPCPCAPTSTMAMWPDDLPRLLGYEAEASGIEELSEEGLRHVLPDVIAQIKEQIDAGRPAAVWHAFTNAEWDVVTGYDDEADTFIGYGSYNGGEKGPASAKQDRLGTCLNICPAFGAITIGEKTGTFDARGAELNALEEAVRHARAPRSRFLNELDGADMPWRFANGLACYDVWIRQFGNAPDKTPDGPCDRYPLGVYASTRSAAPLFLREIAPKYPEAQDLLLKAAACYEEDAAALQALRDDVGWGWGPEMWKDPDPEKQQRSVELLQQARTAYERGAEALLEALKLIDPERAARAQIPVRVERKDGSVSIPDLPRLKYGGRHENTFCGCLWVCTRATAHPYEYQDLMGLSGLAFRTRWGNDAVKTSWCPSATIGEMPDEQAALRRLTGWEFPMDWGTPGENTDALRARIVAEIDAGRPMAVYTPAWVPAVVYGYEDDGRTLLLNDYGSEERPRKLPIAQVGTMQHYLGEFAEPPSLKDGLIAALDLAVRHWQRERHHGGLRDREYWYGKAAFDAWIGDLENYDNLPEKSREGLRRLDGMALQGLCDARQAAHKFLKDWSCAVDGDVRAAVLRAAGIYQEEHQALEPLVKARQEDKNGTQYLSAAQRRQEIALLRHARKLEADAQTEIRAALRATFIETDLPDAPPQGAGRGGPRPLQRSGALDARAND